MFKVESITVKGGPLKDAYSKVGGELEKALNLGVKKGWKLHSWQQSALDEKDNDVTVVIVWEVGK